MKTVSEITRAIDPTPDEQSWAESMGTDYRSAWESAPSLSMLVLVGSHVASTVGFQHLVAHMLGVLGGDGSQVETLRNALQGDSPPGRETTLAMLHGLAGVAMPEGELANLVRAKVSYESLTQVARQRA